MKNPVWVKIILFSLVLFFIRLADAVIAFWAPNQIQSALGNPVIMGAIISVQSFVGLFADLIFPRILKSVGVRKLVIWAIIASAITSLSLSLSSFAPYIALFVMTMALWGIYYELINFANYQFMGSTVPMHMREEAWGFTGIFLALAYFLGPFIAGQMLLHGIMVTQGTIIIFLVSAFILLVLTSKIHEVPGEARFTHLDPILELSHWLSLTKHIWPVISISLVLGFIDSTFWTVGAIWTEKLIKINPWGVWFLPLYLLPAICLGIPLSQWKIYEGKKKMAERFLGLAGLFLIGMAFSDNVSWQLMIVGLSASAIAICFPLVQAVYSDFIGRMGQEKKDMIGLTSSVYNFSYMIWPVFAGLIASKVGERLTFSYLGVGVLVIAIVLLLVTPKKINLPQEEIRSWEE